MVWGGAALLWPLILSLIIVNVTAIIAFYAIAIVLDIALLAVWLKQALWYSKRAGRGETFSLSAQRSPETRGIPAKH